MSDSAVYGDERGRPVAADFEYASDSNTNGLDLEAVESRHRVIPMLPPLATMDDKASINPTSMRLYRYSVAIDTGPVVERFEGAWPSGSVPAMQSR